MTSNEHFLSVIFAANSTHCASKSRQTRLSETLLMMMAIPCVPSANQSVSSESIIPGYPSF
jgi:hypothetical protein